MKQLTDKQKEEAVAKRVIKRLNQEKEQYPAITGLPPEYQNSSYNKLPPDIRALVDKLSLIHI